MDKLKAIDIDEPEDLKCEKVNKIFSLILRKIFILFDKFIFLIYYT